MKIHRLREYANVNCNGQPFVHRNSGRATAETPDGYLVPNTPGSISQPPSAKSPGGISSISDTPAVPPKSVFSGSTFGQKFSFSESDKAMNNNDGGGGGTADPSRLAPPDAGTTELVNYPSSRTGCMNFTIMQVRALTVTQKQTLNSKFRTLPRSTLR